MNRRIKAVPNQPYSHCVKFTFIQKKKKSLPADHQKVKAWKLTSGTFNMCESEEWSSYKFP